jgi:2-amino-4-hydroxy-6-hydroxymethyldihydropteridine diphosphokinase
MALMGENSRLAYIAVGSNMGDSELILASAMSRLQALSTTPLMASRLMRSKPVNCPPGSRDFLNGAIALNPYPGETPESLLGKLQAIEVEFGRTPKTVLNEARPLDLDLISFGPELRDTPKLTLPHPRAAEREFVLGPLAEIAPELRLPGYDQTVVQLLEKIRN